MSARGLLDSARAVFSGASSFNQPLSWDTSAVTNMRDSACALVCAALAHTPWSFAASHAQSRTHKYNHTPARALFCGSVFALRVGCAMCLNREWRARADERVRVAWLGSRSVFRGQFFQPAPLPRHVRRYQHGRECVRLVCAALACTACSFAASPAQSRTHKCS